MSGTDFDGRDEDDRGKLGSTGSENPRSAESRSHESRSGVTHDPHDSRDRDALARRVEDANTRHGMTSEQIDRQAQNAVRTLRQEGRSSSVEACRNWLKAQKRVVGGQETFRKAVKKWNAFFDRLEAEASDFPEMPENLGQMMASQAEAFWRETYRAAQKAFETDRTALETKAKEAEAELEAADARYDKLRKDTDDDMIRLHAEISAAKGQVEGLIARASAAEARVQVLEAAAATSKEHEEARQAELTRMRDRLAELERQSGELLGKLDAAEKVGADLRSDLDDAVSKHAAAETRAIIAETSLEGMRERAERAEDRLDRSAANRPPRSAPRDGSPDPDPDTPAKPATPSPKRGRGRGPARDG